MSSKLKSIFGWFAPSETGNEDVLIEAFAPDAGLAAVEPTSLAAPPPPTAVPPRPTIIAEPRASEHRRVRRNRVLMDGKVTYALGARSIDCTIRDLSETGARVRLVGPEPVPEQVVLIQMRSGVAYEATVAWARDRDLGLNFNAAHRLDDDCPPSLAPLRRLWLEHLPR